MPYVFDMTPGGPITQIGQLEGLDEKVPDLSRRADISRVFMYGTRPLAPDEMPSGVVLKTRRPRLPDGFKTHDALHVVSDAARQAIESLEPDTHQFFPLALRWRNGEAVGGTWWGINVTQRRDTVVEEGSKVGRMTSDPRKLQIFSYKQIVLDPARVGDAHLWREERFIGELFCSDALHAALKAQGLKVFRLHKARPPGYVPT